jgi:hypothetical protein
MCVGDAAPQQLEQPGFQACLSSESIQRFHQTQECLLNRIFGVGILSKSSSRESQQAAVKLRDKFFPIRTVASADSFQKLLINLAERTERIVH